MPNSVMECRDPRRSASFAAAAVAKNAGEQNADDQKDSVHPWARKLARFAH
jgi:hypothetical protein